MLTLRVNGLGKLFGTDGVRGVANEHLTPELAYRLGHAAALVLGGGTADGAGRRAAAVIGRDTRRSGDMLTAALAAGVAAAGCDVHDIGVLPTPGVAHWTRTKQAPFGVVISASHNPPQDNGIKFFGSDGFKLNDDQEATIETHVRGVLPPGPIGDGIGRVLAVPGGAELYMDLLETSSPRTLDGLRVVVDCAHGAAHAVGPAILERLGAQVIPLGIDPDGMNINVGCGSLHTEAMQEAVRRHGADAGISLDGDADRVIMADAEGNIVDGDAMLALCGLHLHRKGRLPGDAIVATVYSNYGLHKTLAAKGVRVVETSTGDRYVMEAMRDQGLVLGGEQSGHIIFLEHNTTGDGLLAALQVLGVVQDEGKPLAKLAGCLDKLPRVLAAVPVPDRQAFEAHEGIGRAIVEAANGLRPGGRLFVRPSGTESVIRVLGEGDDEALVRKTVDRIVTLIKTELA